MTAWQRWVRRPESVLWRRVLFQIHLWLGVGVALYVLLMSVTGSMIVFRNVLERKYSASIPFVEWLVDLHENLLFGDAGRLVIGIGASCVLLLCFTGAIIWWPGINEWRRSLTVNWRENFERVNWDLHSALGFWFFFFVLMWGLSGFYLCFPEAVNDFFRFFDPRDKFTDAALYLVTQTHFGRFRRSTELLWTFFGLVPALLAVTGIFLTCHRWWYQIRYKIPPERRRRI